MHHHPHVKIAPSGNIPLFKMITLGILPSFLKVWLYRLLGATIGSQVKIGLGTVINAKSIHMDSGSKIGAFSFISARTFRMGKRAAIKSFVAVDTGDFELGDDSIIMEQVVVGGMMTPRSKLHIGKRVKVFPFCFINPTEPILIEDDVGVGGGNYLFTHGSWQSILDGYPVSFGAITIKRGTWLPWRVFIMPGVTIGEYATIGAGAVITKDIPSQSLAVGSPAKVIKTGNEYIKQLTLEQKHEIVAGIWKEYAEYLAFQGHAVAGPTDADGSYSFQILDGNQGTVFTYAKSFISRAEGSDVFVSLQAIPHDIKARSAEKGMAWFSLEEKACNLINNPFWSETRNFFGRYGIRFEVIESEEQRA